MKINERFDLDMDDILADDVDLDDEREFLAVYESNCIQKHDVDWKPRRINYE